MKTEAQLMAEKQAAYERQQALFDEHVRHFLNLDSELESFAKEHSFTLEKNALHSPCRFLRRTGNPSYVITIQQEGVWYKVAFRDDLPHTVSVAGYWEDAEREFVYQLSNELAYFVHFATIQSHLKEYLDVALKCVQEWTADRIREQGTKSEHPSSYYRKRGGYRVETVE